MHETIYHVGCLLRILVFLPFCCAIKIPSLGFFSPAMEVCMRKKERKGEIERKTRLNAMKDVYLNLRQRTKMNKFVSKVETDDPMKKSWMLQHRLLYNILYLVPSAIIDDSSSISRGLFTIFVRAAFVTSWNVTWKFFNRATIKFEA